MGRVSILLPNGAVHWPTWIQYLDTFSSPNPPRYASDNIEIGGFTPHNLVSGEHVLFLASFHNNDVTLSQFQVMITLLLSFIESMTVVLPYSPVGKCYAQEISCARRSLANFALMVWPIDRYNGACRSRRPSCNGCHLCTHVFFAP